jgi:hypothetical protein
MLRLATIIVNFIIKFIIKFIIFFFSFLIKVSNNFITKVKQIFPKNFTLKIDGEYAKSTRLHAFIAH